MEDVIKDKDETEELSVKEISDLGAALWKSGVEEQDEAKKSEGIRLLLDAARKGDVEASAWVGYLLYNNLLYSKGDDPQETAIRILFKAAQKGSVMARITLNRLCFERAETALKDKLKTIPRIGPLAGFDGNIIKINKTGILTPIDAVLEYKDGINIFTLSANLSFFDFEMSNRVEFEKAVISGIKEWEGEYRVFGDQKIRVVINITMESRLADNVYVLPVTEEVAADTLSILSHFDKVKDGKISDDLFNKKRSMTIMGLRRWSTRSRKIILISSEDKTFRNYDEIKHVAKHEFGHALGLGDLYACEDDELSGVQKGTYPELDGYYISDKVYNLVMSDHHGPVSNNDIEMVILAFSENKAQLYQKDKRFIEEISQALGRGN